MSPSFSIMMPHERPADQSPRQILSGELLPSQTAHDFLAHYLPAALSQHFDLSRLQISKESFIDPDLQEHFSDVLYELALNNTEPFHIYILFEHKSYADKWTPLQLLAYITRIWQRQEKKGLTDLPPILPLVVYHGEGAWPYGQQFRGLFSEKLPPEFEPYLPDFRYWVLDLSHYPDEEIKGWAILQACLRLLKYIRSGEFGSQFEQSLRLVQTLPEQQTAMQYIETMLRYAVSAAQESSEDEIRTIVVELLDEGEKLMQTIAEKWFEQGVGRGLEQGFERGIQRGIQRGKAEGKEEGLYLGELNLLTRTLTRLFGELPPSLPVTLSRLSLEQLRQALDVAFEVSTAAEFQATITRWLPPAAEA